MPTASNSPAKACAGHEANRTRRLDQPPSPVTQIHRPARLATRAASFRYGGRHHSGIPGDIIPLYPGDFVGIRSLGSSEPESFAMLFLCQSNSLPSPRDREDQAIFASASPTAIRDIRPFALRREQLPETSRSGTSTTQRTRSPFFFGLP